MAAAGSPIFSSLHRYDPITLRPHGMSRPPAILLHRNTLRRSSRRNAADGDVSVIIGSNPDVSWQIVVGAIAGVTPFVVAGIEFSKRIVKQRRCRVCRGSGLVLRENKYYFRCPSCGGFLPWQSWTRFFTG